MMVTVGLAILGAVAILLIVLVARERTPAPDDVAVAYEWAWDRLDFATLWELSGPELRDGRDRADFVAAKRRAYADRNALRGLAETVHASIVEVDPDSALVVTRVVVAAGETVSQCTLARRNGRWWVIGHSMA